MNYGGAGKNGPRRRIAFSGRFLKDRGMKQGLVIRLIERVLGVSGPRSTGNDVPVGGPSSSACVIAGLQLLAMLVTRWGANRRNGPPSRSWFLPCWCTVFLRDGDLSPVAHSPHFRLHARGTRKPIQLKEVYIRGRGGDSSLPV